MDSAWDLLRRSVTVNGAIYPVDEAAIDRAELELCLELPGSYKQYVRTFGAGSWFDDLFISTPFPTLPPTPLSDLVGWIRGSEQVNEATLKIGRTDNPLLYKSLLRIGGNETLWVGWDASDRQGNELAIHAIVDEPSINQHCGYSFYDFLSDWWIGKRLMSIRGFRYEESKPIFTSCYE